MQLIYNARIRLHFRHYIHPRLQYIPEGTGKDPEARLDAAVIALKTEHVQFHIPLFPNADWEFLIPSKHSKNCSTLQNVIDILV